MVLPAAALVILSAWHVKHIQRDRAVEAAFQRDFSQVLAISEKHFKHRAFELADDVRSGFPTPGNVCIETLDRLLASHPYVAHVFLYDPKNGLVFRSQPSRLQEADFRARAGNRAATGRGRRGRVIEISARGGIVENRKGAIHSRI